jgi:hypothetical protein
MLPEFIQFVLVRQLGKAQGVTADGIGEIGHFLTLYP